ncbi:serine-threonine protein kinase, putative [Bodo saltans]|uniref:non-specific serine/threonine protein kinase n=1 Tax=Bodo saltans TaxID=75058 RepID=A0A0S4JQN5_BODSA|nr:serine-threonine protein kinase, putative [Bodo saltans]|eukprot:CUG92502.1 serine-threonine protein kinase, putative [Bodo saltans]
MNQYRIIDRLASGSFGVVFKAVRLSDNRVLVLKRVNLANMDEKSKNTAREEVELMQQLHHPHIVQHRDAFLFNDEDLCIVMDYYGGGDLSQVVQSSAEELQTYLAQGNGAPNRQQAGRKQTRQMPSPQSQPLASPQEQDLMSAKAPYLPESRIMLWFVEMGLSLHYLHSHRIIHRDLKTQNIFVNTANGEVAVGDFGVARIAETIQQAHAASPSSTGTPLYMAPEVVQGGHATFKSDVWSLGCILYELLALRHPFASTDLSGLMIRIAKGQYQKLPPHYSKPLHRLVDRMLEKDPRKRPLIDEILSQPYVKSYLRTYLSIRVPLESHDSASEQMLVTQLRALGVDVGTETEFTEEVLLHNSPGAQHHSHVSPGGRLPALLHVEQQASKTPVYARLDQNALHEDTSVSLEDIGSPTSKYETIHRSHVTEAFSPEAQKQLLQRKPSHQRMSSQPTMLSFNSGDEENQGVQMTRAHTQRESSFQNYGGNPGRRSTSLEPQHQHHNGNNVEDMKGKTIGEIEQEVRKLRELVRHEEATGRHDDHHSGLASEAVGRAARSKRRDGSPGGELSFPSRSAMTSFSMQGANGGDERAPLSRRGPQSTSQFYRSNPEVAGSSSLGQYPSGGLGNGRVSELSKIQRRRQLHLQCVQALGEKAFHDVYRYYHAVQPNNRDAEVVRHFVPDRASWPILPIVEAIVQIDREAMTSV